MPIERLDERLDGVWRHRLALVVAPAGSGKTALLTRLAGRAQGPVGWYRAEAWDRDEESMLRHIEAALGPGLVGLDGDWSSVADAVNTLERWSGPTALLVVDDIHTLHGTPAEAALERLIGYAPDSIRIALASRVPPSFDLSRLRVSGDLLEFDHDDLRLRSWEVERLFRDFYAEPLPPEELAWLARRTEGWAAGLQLFHLATRGQTVDERRRLLTELGSSARMTREYLAHNVLHQLPDDTRRFMLDTSVLGRLSGPLCDQLLARTGGANILADLERRRLFTQPLLEEGIYRYHQVLRTHLLAALLDELGDDGVRARFSAAGNLLAQAGAVSEALEAYCRAEDWEGARRLLERRGELVAERPSEWVEALPAPMVRHDPWLLLASARILRAEGRLVEAIARYEDAEIAFDKGDAAAVCHAERQGLVSWLGAPATVRHDSFSVLRAALRRDPIAAITQARTLGPTSELVSGLVELAAGNVASARRDLLHAAHSADASRAVVVMASLGAGAAGALMGLPNAQLEMEGALTAAESAGLEWLAHVGRAALALTGSAYAQREALAVAESAAVLGDDWGRALAELCAAFAALENGIQPIQDDGLVARLHALDAGVLEAWARALLALGTARAGAPEALSAALAAEAMARSVSADGALLIAHLALAEATDDPVTANEYRSSVLALSLNTGLRPPAPDSSATAHESVDETPRPGARAMDMRLLGGFELTIDGQPVDLAGIRPRARALLRLLALNAGTRVHHEIIEAALWPNADPESSARNLHVAIATLRRAMEPASGRGAFHLLRRDGDAYVMSLPDDSRIDLLELERAIVAAHQARAQGEVEVAARRYQEALDLYRGDLLPEDGPADWATERREACRLAAVEAAQALAEIQLARGEEGHAARACRVGLRIERYHDPLWRLLIQARDQAGDIGAAHAARMGYDRMLAELDVRPEATGSSPL